MKNWIINEQSVEKPVVQDSKSKIAINKNLQSNKRAFIIDNF